MKYLSLLERCRWGENVVDFSQYVQLHPNVMEGVYDQAKGGSVIKNEVECEIMQLF